MRYLNLLLVFSFEVTGIIIVGFVVREQWHVSELWVGIGVTVLILGALVKFLWLLSRWKH